MGFVKGVWTILSFVKRENFAIGGYVPMVINCYYKGSFKEFRGDQKFFVFCLIEEMLKIF